MKLSPWTIIILGIAVAVIALSFATFWYVIPNNTDRDTYIKYGADLKAQADLMPRAQQRVETAIKMVNEKAAEWQRVVARRTPPGNVAQGGINLAINRWQLVVDARKFRNNIQRAVNRQLRKGGVLVINGPQVPFPGESASTIMEGYFNYPAIAFPVCMFDLGTVTIQGTFDQIATNVQSWSYMPNYLAVVDGLRITGTSPNLTATYTLSLVAYIRGTEVAPPVPEGGAQAVGGGGGAPGFGGAGRGNVGLAPGD
jgi:hypothetical protein